MRKNPKIALISDFDVDQGAGKYAQYLYEFLREKYDTTLLYLDYSQKSLVKNPGNEREIIAKVESIPFFDNWGVFKPWFWKLIKKKIPNYDFYHMITPNLSFLMTEFPFIITVHDLAPLFIPSSRIQKWGRLYLYSGIKKALKVIADSHSTKNDVVHSLKIPEEKIKVIPLGVNLKIFKPQDKNLCRAKLGLPVDKKIILNVALEMWRKNLPNLVRAFALACKKFPEVILVRIGHKTPQVAKLISELKIEDKVLYFSNLPKEDDLALFYNAADLFVFPSYYEGFGLPPLEAMACGVPAILSDRTSLPEIAQDQKVLVNPDSPEEIANKILEFLTNENFYQEMSQKAYQHAQKFTWEKMGEKTCQIYSEILGFI